MGWLIDCRDNRVAEIRREEARLKREEQRQTFVKVQEEGAAATGLFSRLFKIDMPHGLVVEPTFSAKNYLEYLTFKADGFTFRYSPALKELSVKQRDGYQRAVSEADPIAALVHAVNDSDTE